MYISEKSIRLEKWYDIMSEKESTIFIKGIMLIFFRISNAFFLEFNFSNRFKIIFKEQENVKTEILK